MAEEQGQGGLGTGVAQGGGEPAPSIIDAEGNFQGDWRAGLDENIRGEACLDRIKNFGDMAKSYVSAMKTFGSDRVLVPTEKSGDEEWEAFYNAGGRPQTAEGYALKRPDDLPEELWDTTRASAAQELFHKIGLNPKQAAALLAFDVQGILGGTKAREEAEVTYQKETADALRKNWGGKYEENMHLGRIAIDHGAGGDKELQTRVEQRFGNDPDFIRFAANIGAKFDEHHIVHDSRIAQETAGQIDEKIEEARKDPAYMNRKDPRHKRQVELVTELHKKKAAASKGQS